MLLVFWRQWLCVREDQLERWRDSSVGKELRCQYEALSLTPRICIKSHEWKCLLVTPVLERQRQDVPQTNLGSARRFKFSDGSCLEAIW